jgi:DNA-binding NtrC family response regulator
MPDKPLVLVIDDETGSRESMAIALEKAGLAVRTFDDARKALEFLDENDARLAVCDLRMPAWTASPSCRRSASARSTSASCW